MDAGVIQKTKIFDAHMAPEKVWGRVMSPACDAAPFPSLSVRTTYCCLLSDQWDALWNMTRVLLQTLMHHVVLSSTTSPSSGWQCLRGL